MIKPIEPTTGLWISWNWTLLSLLFTRDT